MKCSRTFFRIQAAISLMVLCIALCGVVDAHDGCARSSSRSSAADESSKGVGSRSHYVPLTGRAPHRGQIVTTKWQSFEIVYLPQETRVYFYDYMEKPFTARGASGDVIMQVVGNPEFFRNPLRYVPQPPGSQEQDYLAALVDVTQIRDGDMRVYFDLINLPYSQEPKTRFDRPFALLGRPPAAAKAADIVRAPGTEPLVRSAEPGVGPGRYPTGYPATASSYQRPTEEKPRFVLPQTGFGGASKCDKGCCK